MTSRRAVRSLRAWVGCSACVCAFAGGVAGAAGVVSPLAAQPSLARAGAGVAAHGAMRSVAGPRAPLWQTVPSKTVHPRPSLEPARVVGEALAGAYAGIAGYFIGSMTVGGVAELTDVSDDVKERIAFVGGVVGAGAATAASVWAIGNIGDQTGSFPISLAGTGAGVALGILLNQMIYGHARLPSAGESSRMRWVEASLEALLPSIGATIAFNSTRRFK